MSEHVKEGSNISVTHTRRQDNQLNTAIELTDDAGAASHRVAGKELPDWHQDVYRWVSRQLRPVVDTVDVHAHGGSLLLADVLPESNHVELSEGLTDMRTFPPAYDTPAKLFSEYVGRHYTACRRAWAQSTAIDQLATSLSDVCDRLTDAEDEAELMGALVTLADRLLTLGDHLSARNDVLDTEARRQLRNTSVQSPQAVTQALTQYADQLPSACGSGTTNRDTASLESSVEAGKRAFAAIMYARWDASVEDCWPLQFGEYQLTFDRPSPVTQMTDLPNYEAYGLLSDLRAFIETLDERTTKIDDGWYLEQFSTYVETYCRVTQAIAEKGIETTIDQLCDEE